MRGDQASRRGATPVLAARIWFWRARHGVRVLAGCLVVLAVARTLAPAPPPTTAAVVTARPVAAGDELTRADLRVVGLPGTVPRGTAAELDAVLGRSALVDLPAGLPVVEPVLRGARFGVDPPDGTVVVPLALTTGAMATMLRPGDHVDVVTTATDDGGVEEAVVLARRALVVDVREPPGSGGLGTALAPAPDSPVPTVSVAVSPAEGRGLAATSGWSALGAVLVP